MKKISNEIPGLLKVLKSRYFVLYTAIGLTGVTIDFLIFALLVRQTNINYLIANFISISIAILNNFLLNAYVNFKSTDKLSHRFVSFYLVGLLGIGLSQMLLGLLIHLGMSEIISKLFTLPPVLIFQFFLNKQFSFSDKPNQLAAFIGNICSKIWSKKLWIAATIPLFVLFVYTSLLFYTNSISFDESYNLQVPVNLATHGLYASNGGQFDSQLKEFDPFISTGPTLLVPIALMFKVFGTGVWQYRVITYIIYIIFCILTIWFVMKSTSSPMFSKLEKYSFGLLATSLAISFAGTSMVANEFFFTIAQGEALAISFTILSLILIQYKKLYWAAMVLGLAILTKLLFLLMVPFFILEILIALEGRWPSRIKKAAYSALLIALPSILFEFYRLISLEFSFHDYVNSLREFIHFFKIAGGDPNTTNAPLHIIAERLKDLAITDKFTFILLCIVVVVVTASLGYRIWIVVSKSLRLYIKKSKTFNALNIPYLYGFGSMILWMFWWLFVSSTGWTRYAIAPIVLLLILSISLVYVFKDPKYRLVLNSLIIVIVIVSCAFIINNNKISGSLNQQKELAVVISNKFGEKEFYHFNWWQNPEMQFLTNRTSLLYNLDDPAKERWVLMSNLHKKLALADYTRGLSLCNEIMEYGDYRICVIRK